MTEIIICNSGSKGNGYLIKSGGQILVLELGCKFNEYINNLTKEELLNVAGCTLSHR